MKTITESRPPNCNKQVMKMSVHRVKGKRKTRQISVPCQCVKKGVLEYESDNNTNQSLRNPREPRRDAEGTKN